MTRDIQESMKMLDIELQAISSGYDRKTCWVHARAGAIPRPGQPPIVVLTMHKLRITGDDVFYPICDMRTDDGGKTWVGPTEHRDAFARRKVRKGLEEGICDFWPAWHAASGRLLGIGHTVRYFDDNIPRAPEPRRTAYSIYDPDRREWSRWKTMESPYPEEGAGSVQRYDLPDGQILLPTYFIIPEMFRARIEDRYRAQYGVTVMRCTFDGEILRYVEHGNEMTVPTGRGLCEPSLAFFRGRYYLTLRNDDFGAVATGSDGLHYDEPRRWMFDDGSDLGNYNTQQHWVTMPDALYLVYTRRGANNDNVVRHRAPLFIAQVDTDRLCVIRETEQILVPNRGARLGNFGVTRISETESWVTVAEWMQTHPPRYWDVSQCEKYGSDNTVWVARVRCRR